ncbi:MAG: hypothetical protein H6661_02185 [Ardenticatenaceae bacterium]|nr:hypothetical protein [Ardenticatenaceae bacterium]
MQSRRPHFLISLLAMAILMILAGCASGGVETAVTPAPVATVPTVLESSAVGGSEPVVEAAVAPETAVPIPSEPTATLPPTNTPIPPTATAVPPTPTPTPLPINGIPVSDIVVLPPEVRSHLHEIAAVGQAQGRDAHTFSKLGDSTSLNPNFLGKFDDPTAYNLGDYAFLQPTIDYYQGHFSRYGVAARNGLHSWSVFDPLWADKKWCEPNEDVLACEFRLNNPSILFVKLGSNDAGAPSGYRYNMRQVVEFSIASGVIPILVTKADRFEGPDNINNEILRELAAEYHVPLVDFDIVAETLPNRGLKENDVHMEELVGPHDYTQPATFQSGHAVHDLVALLMLDAIRTELAAAAP